MYGPATQLSTYFGDLIITKMQQFWGQIRTRKYVHKVVRLVPTEA
jgi:hypothetical protein